jgi:RHS repeat-associated protein
MSENSSICLRICEFSTVMHALRKACRSRFSSHSSGIQWHGKTARTCFEGAFGEVLRATGPMAKVNPFRFSTKYQDDETDLLYYGYRYYNASTGRWASTDPKEELGFAILRLNRAPRATRGGMRRPLADSYVAARNNLISHWDVLGLEDVSKTLPCPNTDGGMPSVGHYLLNGIIGCLYRQCASGIPKYYHDESFEKVLLNEYWYEGLCLHWMETSSETWYKVTGCGCRWRTVKYKYVSQKEVGEFISKDGGKSGSVEVVVAVPEITTSRVRTEWVDKEEEECGK